MLLCAEYVVPITSAPIENGAVLVRGSKIADVGPADALRLRYPDEEIRDFGQSALLPGFVDAHTHVEYSAMRGVVHDAPYADWIVGVNERSARMTSSDLYDSAVLGGLEALSSGITTLADITASGAAVRALQDLGLRGVVYREVGVVDRRRVDFAMKQAAQDVERWIEQADSERISVGIAPGPLYATHPSIFKKIAAFAGSELPVAMHLAGSREEYHFIKYGSSPFSVDAFKDRRAYIECPPWLPTGATPVNYVLNWGAFEADNVMAVHAVHVSEEDIHKLKEYDVAIAFCPRCNAQLGMGVAPVGEFLKMGLRVGLGTDSPAASDSTDMLTEMRVGMLVQRAVSPDTFLKAGSMLEMATIGGARALKMDHLIGSLEVGKLADIIAVDISASHQTPTTDPASAVVNTSVGTDVLMSMVGGKIRYEEHKWHVEVEVAKSIARYIQIRRKLRD